ncbi:MAG: efflux transporter outer membrane subunit [Proteobacteria bacterium]|nr:efflux transporter outer membrane subunit [Pseudomonadota bacterium]
MSSPGCTLDRPRPDRRWLAAIGALLLAGCTVGPDFHRPDAPADDAYGKTLPPPTAAAGDVAQGRRQRFDPAQDIPGDWWTLFRSRPLDDLIAEALRNNPDLDAARAALAQAHQLTLAQRGAFLPALTASASASREQDPSATLAPAPSNNAFRYSLYTPRISVSYAPDPFGLQRRTLESARAQEQATRYEMIAAQVTLSTNVVQAVVQQASLATQVDATRHIIAIDRDMVGILQYQLKAGYASGLDLAGQQAQLAQAQAALPPLEAQLDQQRHALAALTGRTPAQMPDGDIELASLQLPTELPLSLPSQLVRQRPDVLQAEANLHAANAQVGIAIANRFPNFQISADAGRNALTLGHLFNAGTGLWSIAGELTAPIFDGGALRHQERAAKAALAQSAAQYRSTVLGALRNVADTLAAIEHDAQALQAAAQAADAAGATRDLTSGRFHAGYVGDLAVLAAAQSWQQARIGLAQAQAARLSDTAALYQALGGGWWNRAGQADAQARNQSISRDDD